MFLSFTTSEAREAASPTSPDLDERIPREHQT
jgi:hypothetical protein